jgi:glycosyltransferase involved in cell wall biosynthesis
MMNVIYLFRKRNPLFFSIEKVFDCLFRTSLINFKKASYCVPNFGINFGNLFFIRARANEFKTEIFHVTGDIHYAVLVLPKQRTVLTIHDCVFLRQERGLKRWLLKQILLTLPVRRCKYITTISAKTKNEIIENTGCDPEKILIIPNPVSEELYYSEKKFEKECPRILFIGTTPNKNLERCCAALNGIRCHLIILGVLNEMQTSQLSANGISFEAVSGLTDKDVANLYCSVDIILYPSLYEGFGLPVIESFQAGRVIVCSDISPIKDIAMNGGCLVDPYDIQSISKGIKKVIEDDEYRNGLIRNGFSIVKEYNSHAIAEKYIRVYEKLQLYAQERTLSY